MTEDKGPSWQQWVFAAIPLMVGYVTIIVCISIGLVFVANHYHYMTDSEYESYLKSQWRGSGMPVEKDKP